MTVVVGVLGFAVLGLLELFGVPVTETLGESYGLVLVVIGLVLMLALVAYLDRNKP